MALATQPLEPLIGSEIQLSKQDLLQGGFADPIRELLEQRGVLLFRKLNLSDEEQVEFAKTLGDVIPQGVKGIYKITLDKMLNDTADYLHATYHWHIDGAQDDVPTRASLLTARVLSKEGGQTEFANTYAAYEELPPQMRHEVEALRVVHSQEYIQRAMHPNPTEAQLARWREHQEKVHPMVWTHKSGRKIIWDNTGVMHRVERYPADSGRLLSRTTLVGEEPLV